MKQLFNDFRRKIMKRSSILTFKSFIVLLSLVIFGVVPSCVFEDDVKATPPPPVVLRAPKGKLVMRNITIDQLLGAISGQFKTYDQALTLAKQMYPNAQGVIYYRSIGSDDPIPVGYYAVTFKLVEEKDDSKDSNDSKDSKGFFKF